MKSLLRPTSIEELDALTRFLRRALRKGAAAPSLEPRVMAWKYWDRREDWDEPRSYVLERNGEIVAHAGLYPVKIGEARGVQMIDWAASRDVPGAGISLLRKLDSMFDFIYSIGGSEMTCKLLPAYGFLEHAQQWRGARPLRPFRQIVRHQYRDWKLAPRLARNLLWSSRRHTPPEDWELEEIGGQEIRAGLALPDQADSTFTCRPSGFFEYLLRCPVMKVRLYGIRDKRGSKTELLGQFAIGVLRRQARVAGVWLRNPGLSAWETAFSLTQRAARQLEDADEVVVAGSIGLTEQGAARSGFINRGYVPVFLLNRKGRLKLPADFGFQLADDDSFFLDSGMISYWT